MRAPTIPRPRPADSFQVSLWMPRPLLDLVEVFADRDGLSCSAAVNRLIAMGFDNVRADGMPRYVPRESWTRAPAEEVKISFTIADHMLELLDYSASRNELTRSAEIRRLLSIPFEEPPVEAPREIVGYVI